MPRKTKEQKELENENIEEKTVKKSPSKTKASAVKKEPTKKTSKKVTADDITSTSKKTNTRKSSTTKKTSLKSENSSEKEVTTRTKKSASTKKVDTKKSKSTTGKKRTTTARKRTTSKKEKVDIVEYYDLPYRYNQTVVKVLAQTPTNLFIYWDISDKDRKNFEEQYGDNFFETTKPILIVHNDTLGYSFEVEINDFANSWYLHVNDSKCDYRVELGRRPIIKTEKLNTDYIYISMSNEIESPNDHILFDKNQKMVYFRNVKTGVQSEKEITSISFIRNMGKIYNIYDLYKSLYKDENIEEIYDLSNPSSGNPSSRKPFIKI